VKQRGRERLDAWHSTRAREKQAVFVVVWVVSYSAGVTRENDEQVVGRSEQEVQAMLRGERNSPITMIFRRGGGGGGEQIVVTLLRALANSSKGAAPSGMVPPTKMPAAAPTGGHGGPYDNGLLDNGLDSITGLKSEFSNLSFLWGVPVTDAVEENMRDWKLKMLYGFFSPHSLCHSSALTFG